MAINLKTLSLALSLEAVWPSKPAIKAVLVSNLREEGRDAFFFVARCHGLDEAIIHETLKQVLRFK